MSIGSIKFMKYFFITYSILLIYYIYVPLTYTLFAHFLTVMQCYKIMINCNSQSAPRLTDPGSRGGGGVHGSACGVYISPPNSLEKIKKEHSKIVLTLMKQCAIIQTKGTEADRDAEATGKKKEKREKAN